ncbi:MULTISPECIES: hypothetical protein [Clostridiaceae]|uniref:Foldase protein PrsA n=1 Tax=Clostridium facile TaxID=2763035 RepID=A0ABR7ITN7_9CLOT|nr:MULTISPECIES: hypothetical protein [Clostridiaceae]MBC5788497.1 hypothetical protein [Clostridium facile]PWM99830.1 MAG: hypothetical protein DBX37_03545 [Massilioclostridium sp.]
MSLVKKFAAFAVAAVLAVSATGCNGSPEWVMKTDNYSLGSGSYLDIVMTSITNATNQIDMKSTEDLFDQKIGDQSISDWVLDDVEKQAKIYMAVNQKFEEEGLELSEEELSTLDAQIASYYPQYQTYYAYDLKGISEDSFREVMLLASKQSKLFQNIYGEGGTQEVSNEEMKQYYSEHAAKYKAIPLQKDSGDDETAEKNNQDLMEKAEGYLERINNGESIDDVYAEHQTSMNNQNTTLAFSYMYDTDEVLTELRDAVFGAEIGGPAILLDLESSIYIIQRSDHMADEAEVTSANTSTINRMKLPEFEEEMLKYADENCDIQVNNSMIKKYTPKKVYNKGMEA